MNNNFHTQADYSAIPPANSHKAPWQHHREPDHGAEDPWNHSPDARMHPELHNSAYGTVTAEDEKIEEQAHNKEKNNNEKKNKKQEHPHRKYHHEGSTSPGVFGHTVETKRSPQAFVKRDLDNI